MALLLTSACGQNAGDSAKIKYREIGWAELKPVDENPLSASQQALGNLYADDYSEGLGGGLYSGAPTQAYSAAIVPEINGENIRVPGFVVPLEFGPENLITEFFLVPYFGACFHKPPPPPNQTIYVKSVEPIEYESIYAPVWIMGGIKTEQIGNEIATAAYTMDLHSIEPYAE